MSSSCRIAIVGGGLAGIAAAHALKTFGIEAEVFEAAPALGEIGAAVNVSPQAVKALQAIGVGDKIAAVGHTSPGIYTRNMQTGEFLEFNDRHKAAAAVRRALLHLSPRRPAGRARERARSQRHSSGTPPDRTRGAKRPRRARVRQRRRGRSRDRDRRRRRALGHPPGALRRRQSDLYRADGLARAAERQRRAGGGARADRAISNGSGRAAISSPITSAAGSS